MRSLNVAAAQFQPRDGDKEYNLSVIKELTRRAKKKGAEAISFHELSITAYTFLKDLSEEELAALAEPVPNGKSTEGLIQIAKDTGMTVMAGLVEEDDGKFYNTYIAVDAGGLLAKHRKLHPFISAGLSPGNHYSIFKLGAWTCGILTCYDNNIIENVRATVLLGAEIIFAPHVTGLTPSPMPGRGFVKDELWKNREKNPEALRKEFDGPKGREWLMHWLPARAYDNGVYYVFSNPIGYDGDQLKNGNALILDPFGNIISEVKSFEDEICSAQLTSDKLTQAGGFRYRNARRPELYGAILGKENKSETRPVWMK